MLINSSGNPDLGPQTAESFTVGFDFAPAFFPGLAVSGTYFVISFDDRITAPPILGSFYDIFFQLDTLGPFIERSPDFSEVQAAFNSPGFLGDFGGGGPGGVEAIFDNRLTNIASTQQSGIDLSGSYSFDVAGAEASVFGSITHIEKMEYRSASGASTLDLVNTYGQPPSDRARLGVSFSRDGFFTSLIGNYTGSYRNPLFTPARTIDSATTADLQLGYRLDNGSRFTLTVANLSDERPPLVDAPTDSPGYDPANSSPLGRLITLQLAVQY